MIECRDNVWMPICSEKPKFVFESTPLVSLRALPQKLYCNGIGIEICSRVYPTGAALADEIS
jgi:hypothetical protein